MSCNGDCLGCKTCSQGFSSEVPSYGQVDINMLEKELTDFVYDPELHSSPNVVFLGVTARCNLSCEYCFVNQHNADMDLQTAINAVELAIKNGKKKGNNEEHLADVIFFGGEPLLRYKEIMVPIIEKYSDRASFTFTTNATLLDEDKVDFFYTHNCTPLISLDGIKEVQDYQRPGKGFSSFDAVVKNLPYIIFRFPDVTMRATVGKKAIPHLFESYEMGKEIGFQHFSFCINAFDEWSKEDAENYRIQMEKIGEDIFRNSLHGVIYTESTLSAMYSDISNVIYNTAKFNNQVVKCGMGTTTFSVTPDGDIVPCQEKISNPTWILGNVNNGGYDFKQHEKFLKWYIKSMETIHCPNNCGDLTKKYCLQRQCSSRLEDLKFKMTSSICASSKIQAQIAMKLWHLVHDSMLEEVRAAFSIGEVDVCE